MTERQTCLGGGDVAAIAGLSRYRTAMDVYLAKVEGVEVEQTDVMRRGVTLELPLLDAYGQMTQRPCIQKSDELLRHPDKTWAGGHIDAISGDRIVEAKTTTRFDAWADGVPFDVNTQVQWYMAVAGKASADVVASIASEGTFSVLRDVVEKTPRDEMARLIIAHTDFRVIEVPRDDELIAALLETGEKFWTDNVLAKVPPPITSPADARKLWPVQSPGLTIEASGELYGLILSLPELKAQQKKWADEEERIKTLIMAELQDAEILTINDVPVFTWREVKRKGFTVEESSSRRLAEATKKDRGEK